MAAEHVGRQHYRVEYPDALRPAFSPDRSGRWFPVANCGERGFRYTTDVGNGAPTALGQPIAGKLRFHDGESISVSGVIVRIQSGDVAVHLLNDPIPFRRILKEQLVIRKRYPALDRDDE